MKARYRILSLALLCGCLTGCADSASNPDYLTAREFRSNRSAGEVSEEFRAAYADLTLKLLTSCRTENGSDTMISPLSVMTALAMTANGADGQTLAQMEALLGGGMDIETLNQQVFNFYSALSSTEAASFKAANSIWLTSLPTFTVNPDFIKTIENTYNADILSVDFSKSKEAADTINDWCNEKTDGIIPSIADESNFDASTVMALLNALTFDAEWERPYDDEECKAGIFHGTNGDTNVTMLHFVQYEDYLEGERETGFIRYYKGRKYAFVALLPNEEGDISDYLSTLNGSYLLNLIHNTMHEMVITDLPVFSQETTLDLRSILTGLGMSDAFNIDKADFSGIGSTNQGFGISRIFHKTFIEVNQIGTRAGTITLEPLYGATPDRKYVTLDRPFVYAIIDTATSLPIFIGSCENVA